MSKSKKTRVRRANITIDETTMLPDILKKLSKLVTSEVHIGAAGDEEIAMIAAIHEYGSLKAGIPARSFIGTGRKKASAAISKLVKSGLFDVVERNKQPEELLKEIGRIGREKVLKNFDKIKNPPLSPIYAKRKGSNKILVQQEQLRNSLTYILVPRKGGRR